jgi:hypothetical protein
VHLNKLLAVVFFFVSKILYKNNVFYLEEKIGVRWLKSFKLAPYGAQTEKIF